jgi:hypothetical protein
VSQEELTFESELQRLAGHLEVTHVVHIASRDWHQFWTGRLGMTLKEPLMTTIFFLDFAFQTSTTTTVQLYALTCLPPLITIYRRLYRDKQWPLPLIMKREFTLDKNSQLRKFNSRSDLLLSKSSFPRLLVEVSSESRKDRPEDLVRMLLTGAAIVRFANGFLNRFMVTKNFVLCAIYVWDDGQVSRYSLYQEPNRREVCWTLYINKLAG